MTVKSDGSRGERRAGNGQSNPQQGSVRRGLFQRISRREVYSALDLGTNNCRLLIAKPVHGGFKIIDAFSRIVRLGEGLGASGELSPVAMDRTIDALKVCAEKIQRRKVTKMRHVATEACRLAGNSSAFVSRVYEETGLALDVITAGEEARLAALGCHALFNTQYETAVIFDIGGGSTELVWVELGGERMPKVLGWVSMPYGVVNVSERLNGGSLSQASYRGIFDEVSEHISVFEKNTQMTPVAARGQVQMIGTSGTVTTLASVQLGLDFYDRNKVDGSRFLSSDISGLSKNIATVDYETRAANACVGTERADLVAAGCAILDAILSAWPIEHLHVADRGIREGILWSLMKRDPLVNARSRK